MGEMSQSINYHYSRKNLVALYRIAEDITVDEDDRELAENLAKKVEEELDIEEEKKEEKEI